MRHCNLILFLLIREGRSLRWLAVLVGSKKAPAVTTRKRRLFDVTFVRSSLRAMQRPPEEDNDTKSLVFKWHDQELLVDSFEIRSRIAWNIKRGSRWKKWAAKRFFMASPIDMSVHKPSNQWPVGEMKNPVSQQPLYKALWMWCDSAPFSVYLTHDRAVFVVVVAASQGRKAITIFWRPPLWSWRRRKSGSVLGTQWRAEIYGPTTGFTIERLGCLSVIPFGTCKWRNAIQCQVVIVRAVNLK